MKRISLLVGFLGCLLVGVLSAHQSTVCIGGAVAKPGIFIVSGSGDNLSRLLAKAGFDIEVFERITPPAACPVRIHVGDSGKKTEFNPASDAKSIAAFEVRSNVSVDVRDYRLIPGNLKARRESLTKYIEFGSTDLAREITNIAVDEHEHTQWKASAKGEKAKSIDHFLKCELERLFAVSDGKRIVGLLKLHVDFLHYQGLGDGHPDLKEAKDLVAIAEKTLATQKDAESEPRE